MPAEFVLTEEERHVDACILGTGLTESLIAASLARHGRRVLHLDRAEAYGGDWRALNLRELEAWAGVQAASDVTARTALPEGDGECAGALAPAAGGEALPTPDRDISHLEAVDLEPEPVSNCCGQQAGTWDPFSTRSAEESQTMRKELLGRGGTAFSIDLVPRLLFGRSEIVDVLIESGVARYLEFQGLKSARVLTATGLVSVPLTKSEIFQDPQLTLAEKRMLMKFITSMSPFVGSLAFQSAAQLGSDQAWKLQGPSDSEPVPQALVGVDMSAPWVKFLETQKLSVRLQEFLTYAICLWDWAPGSGVGLTVAEGLRCLGRFVSSLGMHGRGTAMPLLYPMYGASEMAQGFTRMCALHRGTYALRTSATQLLLARGADGTPSVAGLVTQRGEVVWTRSLISSCDHLAQRGLGERQGPAETGRGAAAGPRTVCRRMIVITDCPLLGEDGLHLCVAPPSCVEPPLNNVVQVLQLDWTTGSCPRGYNVVHLSQVAPATPMGDAESAEGADVFGDLQRILAQLLARAEGGERRCLFRCTYLHAPRGRVRWDAATPGGGLLGACADALGGGLAVSADPSAAPQLLGGNEVAEAREVFLRTAGLRGVASGDAEVGPGAGDAPEAVTAEDFLRKPEHVALEERGMGQDELEAFNEEMLQAQQAALPAALAAAVSASAAAAAGAGSESDEDAAVASRPALEVAEEGVRVEDK